MGRMGLPDFLRSMQSRDRRGADFDRLLREHIPALYRQAYRWTGAADRAEDLVQDLMVRLYPRLDELRGLDQVKPWALRVMYRIFVDQLRRQRNSPVTFGREAEHDEDNDEGAASLADEDEPDMLVDREIEQGRIVAAW